jgi:hypothetical protein
LLDSDRSEKEDMGAIESEYIREVRREENKIVDLVIEGITRTDEYLSIRSAKQRSKFIEDRKEQIRSKFKKQIF